MPFPTWDPFEAGSTGHSGYATIDDVQSRVPRQMATLGVDSQPTAGQVALWIESVSGWMDAVLRWKYVVPVTAAADLATLNVICSMLVAAMVWDVLGGHSAEVPGNAAQLRKSAYAMFAYSEREGRSLLVLPGTTLADDGEADVGQAEGSFTDPDTDEGADRLFGIEMEW